MTYRYIYFKPSFTCSCVITSRGEREERRERETGRQTGRQVYKISTLCYLKQQQQQKQ